MLFIEDRLENKIIGKLSKGSISSPDLIAMIVKENKVTEQGAYKALSFLLDNEIVTKSKKLISLNTLWIEQLRDFSNNVSDVYSVNDFNSFLNLENKEKITYHFKNTTKLDIYWLHLILLLLKRFKDNPFVIFNPHCWFMIERPTTESAFFQWINKNKRPMFFLIGAKSKLDKAVKKQLESKYVKIELDFEGKFPKDKYVSVVGDYIIYSCYGQYYGSRI